MGRHLIMAADGRLLILYSETIQHNVIGRCSQIYIAACSFHKRLGRVHLTLLPSLNLKYPAKVYVSFLYQSTIASTPNKTVINYIHNQDMLYVISHPVKVCLLILQRRYVCQ